MKRFLIIAVMFAIISGTFAPHLLNAQGLVFSGYLNSGAGLGFSNGQKENGDDHPSFFAVRANDAEQNGFRLRLNGQYTNEAKTAGARFRFQMQGGGLNPAISHAWGWMNFFDNIVQLNGGRIEDSTFTTGDFWLASDSVSRFSGDGVLLKVMPVNGLTLGGGLYATGRDGSNVYQDFDFTRITAHAAYSLKDVFRFDFSYRTDTWLDKNNPENKLNNPDYTKISGTSEDGPSMIFADLRLLAVKDLTAIAAVKFSYLENFNDLGTMTFSETFGYKINDLNVGINAVQFMSNVENYDAGMLFNPWVSYAISNFVPRLDFVYMMAGRSSFVNNSGVTTTDAAWHRHGFNATGNKDFSVINIRPSVTINVDSRTKLEIGDSLYIDNYKKSGSSESLMTNVFYIDMILNF